MFRLTGVLVLLVSLLVDACLVRSVLPQCVSVDSCVGTPGQSSC